MNNTDLWCWAVSLVAVFALGWMVGMADRTRGGRDE